MIRLCGRLNVALVLAALAAGCTSSPPPQSATPPKTPTVPSSVVAGASDSVGAIPGSADALFIYRFRLIEPPSDRFNFQDRDLNFYFRPSPDAIHLQIENRQGRPVVIDWQRCSITDPFGRTDAVAHSSTKWVDRFSSQAPTTILGQQRYGDYVFPMSYMVEPGGSAEQLHRPIFPEDSSAPQYTDREVGIVLSMTVEDRPREYLFRFKAVSVIPR